MDSLFPVGRAVTDLPNAEDFFEAKQNEVFFGQSWLYDFDSGEFVISSTGKAAVCSETQAWMQWCQKAIKTPRYHHIIYSRNYGHELDVLVGSSYAKSLIESEVSRMVKDALMVDLRTADVDQFVFVWNGDKCTFTCRIINVYQDHQILQSEVRM